jgi:hypothetical protein
MLNWEPARSPGAIPAAGDGDSFALVLYIPLAELEAAGGAEVWATRAAR